MRAGKPQGETGRVAKDLIANAFKGDAGFAVDYKSVWIHVRHNIYAFKLADLLYLSFLRAVSRGGPRPPTDPARAMRGDSPTAAASGVAARGSGSH